jgi:uncharacterized protein (DUF2237 family)
MSDETNVLGEPLESCCQNPETGFYRDGYCRTGPRDQGQHVICAMMTGEFLEFSKAQGNDLTTPMPQHNFPGLEAGDRWCLCAARWKEAMEAGKAPPVFLEATEESALKVVELEKLKRFAVAKS